MARVDRSRLRRRELTPKDCKRIEIAGETLSRAPIFISESKSLSTAQLPRLVRDLKNESGLGLVVVDDLQELYPTASDVHGVPTAQTVPRALKRMARKLNVAAIAVLRLSRRVVRRSSNRITLADLWGPAIDLDADLVVSLFRGEFYISGRLGGSKRQETVK